MLKSITLENFYSFAEPTKIEINSGINVLIGINGSGKSNFLKAIELLYESIAGIGLEKIFLRDWGGFENVANFSTQKDYIKLTYEFDKTYLKEIEGFKFKTNILYEITIHKIGETNYSLSERLSSINQNRNPPFVYLEINNSKGQVSTREKEGKTGLQYYSKSDFKASEPVLRQLSDPERFYPQFTFRKAIEKIAVYGYFDTGKDSAIRKPAAFSIDKTLLTNGLNIASLLNDIKNNHSLDYDKIEKKLRKVNPNFKEIAFSLFSSNIILALREEALNKAIMVSNLSDGTLRYILLMAIFYNPDRGSLICLDEPEIGLHPDMISLIGESLIESSNKTQYFIATHSPLVLNQFEIEDLLVFEKDDLNQSIVKKYKEEDFQSWLENYSTGQLWVSGLIGGKRL